MWRLSAGLDTCLSIMRVLHSGTGDSKYRPCPLLVQYVDAGKVSSATLPTGFSHELGCQISSRLQEEI